MMDADSSSSLAMRCCLAAGLESLAWSLRRLHCPVGPHDLVLEVGSGHNPYFRANVLLDAYEQTRERHWAPLIADRPTVLGFVERLPFRDKAFDFVIASHVLEHSAQPEKFLTELQRVASAGYIEVPDAFMERINPYRDHRLEITVRGGRLLIRKKPSWRADAELVDLYEHAAKKVITRKTISRHPFEFHVRYYWFERIDFLVLNPQVDASWPACASSAATVPRGALRERVVAKALGLARRAFAQRARNRKIRLEELLACPSCGSRPLSFTAESIRCQCCNANYEMRNGIPIMHPRQRV